jgi:hypothetical protein
LGPEGPAGVDEQHLELLVAPSKHQEPRTRLRHRGKANSGVLTGFGATVPSDQRY